MCIAIVYAMRIRSALLTASLLFTACAEDHALHPDAPTADAPTAPTSADAFWDAFLAQRYVDLPGVTAQLDADATAHPADAWATELSAIARLWQIAEARRDPSLTAAQIPPIALAAEHRLQQANALLADDPLLLGRIGSLEVAIGAVLHDATRIDAGKADLDRSVALYPEFALFNRARIFFDLPSDPQAADRVEDFWRKLDACAGEPVDRTAFDLRRYLGRATAEGPQRVCWNTPHTPHGVEGFFVYMGDALLKRGDAASAKQIYSNARYSPQYASWPFQALLEQRISDADAWAARLTDADPSNDPVLINASATACASCHAAR